MALKYLELGNQTNQSILRIKERIIGSNPRLFGQIYKLRSAPYPTIDVKILMPIKASMSKVQKEEKKSTPMYKKALSPVQPPNTATTHARPVGTIPGPRPVSTIQGQGMFVPSSATSTAELAPPKVGGFNPSAVQPRNVPPPIRGPVFRPPVVPYPGPTQSVPQQPSPAYRAPYPQPTYPPSNYPPQPPAVTQQFVSTQPSMVPSPPTVSFRPPVVRPFPRPVDPSKKSPFPNSYQNPNSGNDTYAPPPPSSVVEPPPVTRPIIPHPMVPQSMPRPGPPKTDILNQANFGISRKEKEVFKIEIHRMEP